MKMHWRFTLGQITCGMSGIRSKARFSPQENRKRVKKQTKHLVIFPGILRSLWRLGELLERCYKKEQNVAHQNHPPCAFPAEILALPRG